MTPTEKPIDEVLDSLADENLRLERPYPADVLLVPPVVELEGDEIVWRLSRKAVTDEDRLQAMAPERARVFGGYLAIQPGPGLLRGFAALADAHRGRVLTYAKQWGVLGLCEHGMPACHRGPVEHSDGCYPLGWDGGGGREPLKAWRFYAQRAAICLRVASRLRRGGRLTRDELKKPSLEVLKESAASRVRQGAGLTGDEVKVLTFGMVEDSPELEAAESWDALSMWASSWMRWGGVRPQLLSARSGEPPRLVLAPEWTPLKPHLPLFGALGIQLAFALASERGWACCSACGAFYDPRRSPAAGRSNFCPDCGVRAAWRTAASRYRRKTAQKASDVKERSPVD